MASAKHPSFKTARREFARGERVHQQNIATDPNLLYPGTTAGRNGTFKCYAFNSLVYCFVHWDNDEKESYETAASIFKGEYA